MGGLRPKSVWVLYGGSSSEREVSLKSGAGVAQALKDKGFQVELIDVRPGDSLRRLDWKKAPDIVFLGLHGKFGEDGTIQGFLDSVGVPYVGSGVTSSALCFHKGLAKRHLASFGVAMPFSYDVSGEEHLRELLASGVMPRNSFVKKWFIKPAREGSTIGIERFDPRAQKNPEEKFWEQVKRAFAFDNYLVIEEWIEGPELTVPILQGKALPVIEIRPLSHFYDYQSKYTVGRTEYLCPAPISNEHRAAVQAMAEKSFAALECRDYARMDAMLGPQGPLFLEMNTLPGMTGTSLVPKSAAAAGMDYAAFCEELVCTSYQRQRPAKT